MTVNLKVEMNLKGWPNDVFPAIELSNTLEEWVDSLRRAAYSARPEFEGEYTCRFGTVKWNYEVESDGKTSGVEGDAGLRSGRGHAHDEESAGDPQEFGSDETSRSEGENGDGEPAVDNGQGPTSETEEVTER